MLQINKLNATITRLSFKNGNYNKHEAPETESVKVSNSYISSSPPGRSDTVFANMLAFMCNS